MPLAACLSEPRFLEAINYKKPNSIAKFLVHSCLKIRALIKRLISFDKFPDLLAENYYRTYPNGDFEIEALKPDYFDQSNLKTKTLN